MFADKDWKQFYTASEDFAVLIVTPSATTTTAAMNQALNPQYQKAVSVQPKINFLKELNPTHVTVGKMIAEGFFGVVYAGKYLNTDIAIKTFKITAHNIDGVDKELKLIQ